MHRTKRHLLLFLAICATGTVFYLALHPAPPMFRLSMASAYGSLVLLSATLMIGPWNWLRRRPNPVSSHFRRDIGIWAGVLAVVHMVVGLQVHLEGRFWQYFVWPDGTRHLLPIRLDAFGIANHAGLAAALIALLLLSLSNDASLRALGARRWKSLQRWNYAFALLAVGHGALYQAIEKRTAAFVASFAALALLTLAVQVAGIRAARAQSR